MIYVLTIAAGDPSGGAGYQQDMRVIDRLGLWGLTASTGDTIQTFDGLSETRASDPLFFERQLEAMFASFPIAAIKTGAFLSPVHAEIAVEKICRYRKRTGNPVPVVCDPVIAPTAGKPFLYTEDIRQYATAMIPVTNLLTPNIHEWEILNTIFGSLQITQKGDAFALYQKDGHGIDKKKLTEKLILDDGSVLYVRKKRRTWAYAHGTGCAFSTAAACFLAQGSSLVQACKKAARWIDRYYSELNRRLQIRLRAD